MNYNGGQREGGGSKIMTTMKDFIILTKIGTCAPKYQV